MSSDHFAVKISVYLTNLEGNTREYDAAKRDGKTRRD